MSDQQQVADVEVEQPERVDPMALFSDGVRIPVYGLSFIGHIQKDYEFCGHKFALKTLRPAEKAALAVAIDPWKGTLAEGEVWMNAHVALALVSIDDDAAFCPEAGPSLESHAKARLRYVTNKDNGWHAPTLSFLYDRYLELEAEALDATRELQNLSEGNRQPSQPSPDSLTGPDISDVPMFLESRSSADSSTNS